MAEARPQPFRLDDRVVRPALNEIEGPAGVERLNPRAMEVLVALASHPDGVASKQELLDAVWTDLHVGDEVLSTAIWELRRALGDDARTPRFIRTIPRRGYQLLVTPTAVEVGAGSEPKAPTAASHDAPSHALRRSRLAVGAALAAAALVVGLVTLRQGTATAPPVQSLVVLPFHVLGGDGSDLALADGLGDTLITSLARLGRVRVVSRTTSASYRGTTLTVPEIARQLGVDAVVEGTLARDGDRVVLNAQLIDARTESHLWAQTYERRFEHLLDLQVEIARSIGAAVGSELPAPPTASVGRSAAHDDRESPLVWRFRAGGEIWSTPAVDGDTVVLGSRDGFLYAASLGDGSERWRVPLGREIVVSPTVEAGAVVAATREGEVVAVDATAGRELWRHRMTAPMDRPPAVAADRLVAVDEAGAVAVLDLTSGRLLWEARVAESSDGVAASADLVVATGWDGALTAWDAVDGSPRWRVSTTVRASRPPTIDGDRVLAPVADGTVRALSVVDGRELWRVRAPAPATPVAWRDRVLIGGDSATLTAVDRSSGDLLWRWDAGAWVNPPAVEGERVLVSSHDRTLTVLDPWTGEAGWRIEMDTWLTTRPVVSDDRVLVGSLDGSVYCFRLPDLDAPPVLRCQADGFAVADDADPSEVTALDVVLEDPSRQRPTVRWRVRADGPVENQPAFGDGVLYVSGFQHLLCLDAATGAERWRLRCGAPVGTRPVVAGDLVLAGSRDHTLYAVDAATGAERWRVRTGGDVISTPAVAGGVAYFGSRDHFLYAVDLATGREHWRRQLDIIHAAPAVDRDTVFAASRGDRLWALATGDGAVRWSAPTVDWVVADPVPAGDLVVVGACDGTVLSLDQTTGTERWRAAVHGDTWYTPAVVRDLMILGSADGHVYALDLATGAERWRTATGNRVLSSIAPWRGLVLAGSHDRQLWALESATGRVAWRLRTSGAVSSPVVAGDLAAFGSPDGWVTLLEL